MAPALVETPQELYGRAANSYADKVSQYLEHVSKAELPSRHEDSGIP
jgi:hypothetical protein